MKIIKKAVSLLLAAVLLAALAVPTFAANDAGEQPRRVRTGANRGKHAEYYGAFVQTPAGRINYTILGDTGDTIVLLPGLGTPCPHFVFMLLATELSAEHKVIIIEPLGHGLSDETDSPRSADNICAEIHAVLSCLGEDSYYLMGPGIYMLDYSNIYTDEVLGVVGLDASVPAQAAGGASSFTRSFYKILYKMIRFFGKIYMRVYLSYICSLPDERLREAPYGQGAYGAFAGLSDADKRAFAEIWYSGYQNDTLINESDMIYENCPNEISMQFPESVPVLYILASDTCNTSSGWKLWHEELIDNHPNSALIVLEGNHFIHLCDLEGVVNQTETWINK